MSRHPFRLVLYVCFVVASACGTVSAQDTRRVVRASAPAYPDLMYQSRTQGRFVVAVTVLPSGEVHNAVVTESAAPYVNDILRAHAKRWVFDGQKSTTLQKVEFLFRLLPKGSPTEELGSVFVAPSTMEIRRVEPPIVDVRSSSHAER
jgi:TonB family protein